MYMLVNYVNSYARGEVFFDEIFAVLLTFILVLVVLNNKIVLVVNYVNSYARGEGLVKLSNISTSERTCIQEKISYNSLTLIQIYVRRYCNPQLHK